ncbi:MAG: hypothetical protein NTW96_25330 [Planctomycetia bacterium]|nr:hypothetical protein [Planctomycetia bacterium]
MSPLTTSLRKSIAERLEETLLDCKLLLWGSDDVCDMLDDCPRIRVAFPQVLSLRDLEAILSTIVNKVVVERSRAAVEEARDISSVFVPTKAYYGALASLQEHRFVVLTGPPEMGKTAIARIIGLAKHTEGWQYVDCGTPSDFFSSLDESVPQVFIADDAFGTTEYRPELATPWGKELPRILRRLGPRRWFLWTTRPAPLHFALHHLSLSGQAEKFPMPGAIQVDASELSPLEKAQMLYRHAKAAHLGDDARTLIQQHAMHIVSHKHFTPERVRRFVSERLGDMVSDVKSGKPSREVIEDAVRLEIEEPTSRMRQSFENLSRSYQDFLLALLDVDGTLISERVASEAYYRVSLDAELPPERLAADLNGHFIRQKVGPLKPPWIASDDSNYWEWIHPSWRDIAIDFLATNKPRRQRFLSHCGIAGIGLALSVGGGSEGKQASPLLCDEGDWGALNDRAVELATSADEIVGRRLMVALHGAIKDAADKARQAYEPLTHIGRRILEARRCAWDTAQAILIPWHLKTYYNLSVLVTPLQPSPMLDRSWLHYLGRVEEGVRNDDPADMKDDLEGLLEFIDLLQANEPRFLTQQGFPSQFEELFASCITVVGKYDYGNSQPSDIEEMDREMEYLEQLQGMCQSIATIYPMLRDAATDVSAEIEQQRGRAWEKRDELEEEQKAEERAQEQ